VSKARRIITAVGFEVIMPLRHDLVAFDLVPPLWIGTSSCAYRDHVLPQAITTCPANGMATVNDLILCGVILGLHQMQ
jgi:hypothetical protein